MKSFLFIIITIIFFNCADTDAQSLQRNVCDRSNLSPQEFEKCSLDSFYAADLIIKINYISNLKSDLLPKYRSIRQGLVLSDELKQALLLLKNTYDTVLYRKTLTFLKEMDQNQMYVQPKAYLSSLLSLQVFVFYPDIYAILLNNIHLMVTPKTTSKEFREYHEMVENIYKTLPNDLQLQLQAITTALANDQQAIMKDGFAPMFQGAQSEIEIQRNRIVDFLLWTL